jgi:beta-phosphoglucomutase-like phosphatase (HAD superfamily)
LAASRVSFLFDLDGTLVDSVYQHVAAWQQALHAAHIELSVWRIHRRIGMSGGLFTEMLLREIERDVTPELLAESTSLSPRPGGSAPPSSRR